MCPGQGGGAWVNYILPSETLESPTDRRAQLLFLSSQKNVEFSSIRHASILRAQKSCRIDFFNSVVMGAWPRCSTSCGTLDMSLHPHGASVFTCVMVRTDWEKSLRHRHRPCLLVGALTVSSHQNLF